MKYQNENFGGNYVFRSRIHYGWTVSAHLHEYSELIYCREGEGSVIVDGRTVPLKAKQFVWISPNAIHQYFFEDATVICAVFSNDLIPLFFQTSEGRALIPQATDVGEAEAFLERLYLLPVDGLCRISGSLNLICAEVLKTASFELSENPDALLYQKVISYISEHYTEPLTLKTVASRFGYNEKYLSHSLHCLTGIHFSRLVSFYRVNRAKQLLISCKDLGISEIAFACGFSALNTFHRAFREVVGMLPSEYRRKYRE